MTETATLTPDQLTKLNIMLKEAGLDDRNDALAWISGVLGVDIASRKDLTRSEASRLIDMLADGQVRREDAVLNDLDLPTVQEAVRRVMTDIGHVGVGKGGYNQQQNYRFRGIDDFVQALSPILSRHGVILLPVAGEPTITQHPTSKGGTQFMCVVRVEWTIVGPRGDTLAAATIGQALDTSDKASNKAMSAAFKYALGQVFSIPNIGWAEQDFESPQVVEDDVSDLIDRISELAIAEGMDLEQFTAKFRRDNGNKSVEDMRRAPRDLLQGYINRIERFRAKAAETARRGDDLAHEPDEAGGPSGTYAGQ